MVKNRTSKIMLLIIVFVFLLILPSYSNAAKVSVGKVKGVKIKEQNTTSLKISWKSVSKVNGYKVYICDNSENKFEYYGNTKSNSITIKKLKSSKEYKIKIRGYKIVKKKKYHGSYSEVLKVASKPTQVKSLKVKSETDTSVKLSWGKVIRATGYRVYIYNSSKKKYEYYGYSKTNSITIKDLKALQTYKIKVRAYKTVEGKRTYGTYSKVVTAKTKFSKVKNLKAESQTDTKINLSWNKVSKATGYRVYKYNSSKKKYELYKDLKTNKLTINKLKSSEIYKFKVRAYKTVKKKNEYGTYSEVLTTATKPTEVKNIGVISQNDTQISLKWDKVTRATGYRIYIYNELKDSYDYYDYTETNSIVLKNLKSATTYKIRVRAYKQVDDAKVLGPNPKDFIETFTKPGEVTNLIKTNITLSSIKLSWDNMSDIAEYELYMYNDITKTYEFKDKVLSTSYSLSNIEPDKEYRFRIRAYINIDKKPYFGNYTDIQTRILPEKVTGLKSTMQTVNSIKIEWDKLEEATGYAVYLYNDSSQSYKLCKKTTEPFMEIEGLDTARFYKMYVKSYVTIGEKTYYIDESVTLTQKTLSTESIKAGIDVSKHQGKIDWEKVKDQIDFAIIRLGWVGNKENHTLDEQFERNYSECKRLGIPVGIYIYNYCNSVDTAKSAANWTIKKLKGKTLELPVFIDMEDSSIAGIGKEKLSNICIEFNDIIAKAGYEPGIYANRNWFDNYLNKDLRIKYTCWIAHYTSTNQNYDEEFSIWQYTSKGMINGISGNVDLNIIYIEEKEVE